MAKTYKINLVINAAQAEQANARAEAALKRTALAAMAAANAAEAGANRVAAANERAATSGFMSIHKVQIQAIKDTDKRVALAERRAAADEKAAAKRADAEQRAAAKSLAAQRKAGIEQIVSIDSVKSSAIGLAAKLEAAEVKSLEAMHKASVARVVDINKVRSSAIDLSTRLEADAAKSLAAQKRAALEGVIGLDQLRSSAIQTRLKFDEMEAAAKEAGKQKIFEAIQGAATLAIPVVAALTKQFFELKEGVAQSAQSVTSYRESLLGLAALKGHAGHTGKALVEDVKLRAKTLQTQEQSIQFQNAARGIGLAAINENLKEPGITEKEFEKSLQMTGAFQAMEGGSAHAHGKLVGTIPLISKKRMTGEDVAVEVKRLFETFQLGGPEFPEMAKQYSDIAGYISSGLYEPKEASAILSAFSSTSGIKAATRFEQFTRATMGSQGRTRGTGVEGSEKQGRYLERLGAREGMGAVDIGELIIKDLQRYEAERKSKGEKPDIDYYLSHHGYGRQEDRRTLLDWKGFYESGQLKEKFFKVAMKTPTLEEATRDVTIFQKTDPVARQRKDQLIGQLSNMKMGGGAPEFYKRLEAAAFEQLRGEQNFFVGTDLEKLRTSWADPLAYVGRQVLRGRMSDIVSGERKKVGLPELRPDFRGEETPEQFFAYGRQIAAQGVDPVEAILAQSLDQAVKQTEAADGMRKAFENFLKQQAQGKPAPAQVRP